MHLEKLLELITCVVVVVANINITQKIMLITLYFPFLLPYNFNTSGVGVGLRR